MQKRIKGPGNGNEKIQSFMKNEKIPENLDQAIEFLEVLSKEMTEMKDMSEDEFGGTTHHGFGTNIRNSWKLWWQKSWNEEKPKIVQYFNDLGIYHADDMSGIIMTSFHRKQADKEVNLPGQIEKYKKHWKEQGFKDGIFKND
jgi:uncharacterized protein DUF6794